MLVTLLYCSFTYFWPLLSFKAIIQKLLFLLISKTCINPWNQFYSYKKIDLASIVSLDQIDHGTIFRWAMISNSATTAFLALSLVISCHRQLGLKPTFKWIFQHVSIIYKTHLYFEILFFISDSPLSTKQQSFKTLNTTA